MKCVVFFSLIIIMLPSMFANEVYGTITEGGKPIKEGIAIEISANDKTICKTNTDKNGSYNVFIKERGEFKLKIFYQNHTPSIVIYSYDEPIRYNLILEKKNGKYILRRK